MFWLTNTRLHQRKPSATFRSHVLRGQFALPNPTGTGKDGMNHYRHLPYTRNTETRPPEMHSDWSASVDMEGYLQLCWFLSEEFTSYSQHRHADIAPTTPISRPRTQAWVSHGVSCLRNHILAWNMTFLVLARFTVSRWAVVISFWTSADFSDVNYMWTVRQSPCEFVVTVVTEAWYTDCAFETHRLNFF